MDGFIKFVAEEIFSTAGIVGLLLFAALGYQSWRVERLERQREINRKQAAVEANERSLSFLGLTNAQTQQANTMSEMVRTSQRIEVIVSRIEAAISRIRA